MGLQFATHAPGTFLAGAAAVGLGHLIAVAVTKRDPAFLDVLSRHIRHKEHLAC